MAAIDSLGNSARVLLQILCALTEPDRHLLVVTPLWPTVWAALDVTTPPSLVNAAAELEQAGLIGRQGFVLDPATLAQVADRQDKTIRHCARASQATRWQQEADQACTQPDDRTPERLRHAVLSALPYLAALKAWRPAVGMLQEVLGRDETQEAAALLHPWAARVAEGARGTDAELAAQCTLGQIEGSLDPRQGVRRLRATVQRADALGDKESALAARSKLALQLQHTGAFDEALEVTDRAIADMSGDPDDDGLRLIHLRGRRLQVLHRLGRDVAVLSEVEILLPRLTRHERDRDHWDVYETIVSIGCAAALAMGLWEQALHYNRLEVESKRERHASVAALAQARFNAYGPLLRLGRVAEADQLLRECQTVWEAHGDPLRMARVLSARAQMEHERDNIAAAIELARRGLSFSYAAASPYDIAASHVNLLLYLDRSSSWHDAAAHGLAGVLIADQTGQTVLVEAGLRMLGGASAAFMTRLGRAEGLFGAVRDSVQTSPEITFAALVGQLPQPPLGLNEQLSTYCRIAVEYGGR